MSSDELASYSMGTAGTQLPILQLEIDNAVAEQTIMAETKVI